MHVLYIALAVLQFLVSQTMEFVRAGTQGLGQQAHTAGVYGQLTLIGFEDGAFHGQNVTDLQPLNSA